MVLPTTNSGIVSISGTNVTIDASKGNVAFWALNGANAYVTVTNTAPANFVRLFIYQGSGLTNTVSWNTNYTQPTVYGQILAMPTNRAASMMIVSVTGDPLSGPTNTFTQSLKP